MLLEVAGLKAGYGRITILHGVDLHVDDGEVVCLIGPNGAGKSTVLRAVAGQLRPGAGTVRFQGRDVTALGPRRKGLAGLIFIPQGENIFPNLTLRENLEMAGLLTQSRRALEAGIAAVTEANPWMTERLNRPARELSGGQRQALALGRILMLRPKLVLLDEPSLGLSPQMVETIFTQIRQLNALGISFLMVEQNARKGLAAAHRGYVLEQGRNRLTGTGRELTDDPRVQKLYLGG